MGLFDTIKEKIDERKKKKADEEAYRESLRKEVKEDPFFKEELKGEMKNVMLEEEKAKLKKKSGFMDELSRISDNVAKQIDNKPQQQSRRAIDAEVVMPNRLSYTTEKDEVDSLVNDDKINMMLGKSKRR